MTEVAQARALLGVPEQATTAEIRAAYRTRIRVAHPDRGGTADATIALTRAYELLLAVQEQPEPPTQPAPPQPTNAKHSSSDKLAKRAPEPASGRAATLELDVDPGVAFARLVDAAHRLGNISHLDRSSGIFEAIVTLDDGTHASFVVSLEVRGVDGVTVAWCTLEALERAETLPVELVLDRYVSLIRLDDDG